MSMLWRQLHEAKLTILDGRSVTEQGGNYGGATQFDGSTAVCVEDLDNSETGIDVNPTDIFKFKPGTIFTIGTEGFNTLSISASIL